MRICIISNYPDHCDEGMANIAFYLGRELSKRHEVLHLSLKHLFSRNFWKEVKNFDPQVIHYTHGPSIISFMIVKALAFHCKDAKTVVSAAHPASFRFSKKIAPFLKPDLVLIQSNESERVFRTLSCESEFLPNGVDIEKFTPVSKDIKQKLREKYGLDKEKLIILHIGSIRKRRNIQILNKMQKFKGVQVIVVGSTSMPMEQGIYKSLKESGCVIWRSYFENIEEIYQLSDCYIFPTTNKLGSINLPLSVLEAMSCNLPVIATKFGVLPTVFEEGDGLIFIDKEEEFIGALEKIINTNTNIKTREKVLPYSWRNVVGRLERIYDGIINGDMD